MTKPAAKSFQARLERIDSPLKWVMVRIPFDVRKTWGAGGQFKVRGEINGFAFRTSLFPTGKGGHRLLVNKRMQQGARAAPGDAARFRLEPDTEERVVSVPAELTHILAQERSLLRWFGQLNYSTRKDIANWITGVRSAEARDRRAEQIAERLLSAMEAERELPPLLQAAFAGNAKAREGWSLMSPMARRGQLFAIFYYRSPEARARRIAKVLEDAAKVAEKRARRLPAKI